ncbi:LysR family transcriptional regulator [Tropicimonas marinistellae]|uniref:LysR family transcriptional regulator n=1 Tax=Tropicimonas marinistellae TaxID=1739787 RepID=UPI00082B20C0|nr:LysR family transcriptional regulator [Tropicimonas marinistellae]
MSSSVTWDDQRVFLAVLEEGSLSGAARRLGLSHPTVRARLEGMEAALGTVLFTRSANGLAPTESALALRAPARSMAIASELFNRQASAPPGEVAGTVRLSVPDFIGVEVVPPMLGALRQAHPGLRIELSLTNAVEDVLGQEVDLAIRMMRPAQDALVARKIADIPLGFFAAESYLRRQGKPTTVAELANHDIIGPDRSRPDLMLVEALAIGITRPNLVLRTDNHPAQAAAVRAGLGIGVLQVPVGARDPNLRRVLPDFVPVMLETWIVTHENLRHVPRIRATLDSLTEAFNAYAR